MQERLMTAFSNDVVVRGLKVAVIVGTILVAINQGDAILSGGLSAATARKIPMTCLVPCCVSADAGVSAIIAHRKD